MVSSIQLCLSVGKMVPLNRKYHLCVDSLLLIRMHSMYIYNTFTGILHWLNLLITQNMNTLVSSIDRRRKSEKSTNFTSTENRYIVLILATYTIKRASFDKLLRIKVHLNV
jgi:hypothetical protein